ncbi:MAG: hypothetical protein J0M34_01280 [Alphaproteobacteria bacterium]|nr:hypothetical protein [Alphaproteobacteria bacterium]
MAKKKKDQAAQANIEKRSKRLSFALIILSIFLIAFMRTGFVFFILSILPSIVAYYLDRSAQRYTFHTVFACNLAGTLPFVGQIIKNGAAQAEIQIVMGDTLNWLIIYAAAGFGWLLVYAAPAFAQGFINVLHENQIARLQRMQDRIISEWGKEVDNFNANPEDRR